MVRHFADILSSNFFHINVKADISGYNKPEMIYWKSTKKGHIPDITSNFDKVYARPEQYIFEVETEDSIDDSHTEDQWKLFSAKGQEFRKRFIVIVPRGCKQQALARAKQIGATLWDVWTLG
jgi:GTP-sensing pleiotropic transcriptional regulator CodY